MAENYVWLSLRRWLAGVTNVNPGSGTILQQTVPLQGGQYKFRIVIWSTQQVDIEVQRRNDADSGNLKTQKISTQGRTTIIDWQSEMESGESLRLELLTAITGGGQIQASIKDKRTA